MIRKKLAFGFGIGFIATSAISFLLATIMRNDIARPEVQSRSTVVQVPLVDCEAIDGQLAHQMMRVPYENLCSRLGIVVDQPIDKRHPVMSSALDLEKTWMDCPKKIACKTDEPDTLLILGFNDTDHCPGFWRVTMTATH